MNEIEGLQSERIARLEQTLGTLIIWLAQSAGSPISIEEAGNLIKMLAAPKP